VVAFLFASEIDRLVKENTELKAELIEKAVPGVDRMSYEAQIKDLLDALNKLRDENSKLKSEND